MLNFIESQPLNSTITLKYIKITHFNICYTVSQSKIHILNIHDYFKMFNANTQPHDMIFDDLNSAISYLQKTL